MKLGRISAYQKRDQVSPLFGGKMTYMHQNTVRAGIVEKPNDYLYSSARNFAGKVLLKWIIGDFDLFFPSQIVEDIWV